MSDDVKLEMSPDVKPKLLVLRNANREVIRLPNAEEMIATVKALYDNQWVVDNEFHLYHCKEGMDKCDECKSIYAFDDALDRLYSWFPDIP